MTVWNIPLADTTLGEEEALAAAEVVRSGWVTQGARIAAFENAFAQFVGVPHAIAVSNCTLALELAYEVCGVGPGDEVLVPSLTFSATANAARRRGASVQFVDVCSEDELTLDPEDVARKITDRTRVIAPVHYAGYTANVRALQALIGDRPIAIVEDCAHSPGAHTENGSTGALGAVGCFSFFGNKNLTTGEGGMLTTKSDELAKQLRLLRSHGMSTGTWDRHRGHAFTYDVTAIGTNARMDEIRAAIGTIQLQKLTKANAQRNALVEQYRAWFEHNPIAGLSIPFSQRSLEGSAHHLFVVLLPEGTDRAAVMQHLKDRGVQSSIHYPLVHRFAVHASPPAQVPVAERIGPRLLTLPLYPHMTKEQLVYVCEALRGALR